MNEGDFMELPIEIITMDSLMKRWNMSFMDILLVVVNQDLTPVYREDPSSGWNKYGGDPDHDILALFYDPKADASRIIFLRSDVQKIEEVFGGQLSKSPDVIYEKDLLKRFGISEIELWHLQKNLSIDLVDPLGMRIDDIEVLKEVPGLVPGEGVMRYYFRLSDVEKLEKEYRFESENSRETKKEKKLRPNQRHKKRCREIAERLWKVDSEITIADMAFHDEITTAFDGKMYAEKTIRNWIKDLCPDRSPGRRPKV
jgi:hypothetical protein